MIEEPLLIDIIHIMDVAILHHKQNGHLHFMGTIPEWCTILQSRIDDQSREFRVQEAGVFLEEFIREARHYWLLGQTAPLKSGPWIEMDDKGNEIAFEATAVCSNKRKLFLIQRLGTEYDERRSLLQKAREGSLLRHDLEVEVNRRTADIRRREEEIALRLIDALGIRDFETGGHIRRIGLFSEAIAYEMGWDAAECESLRIAASMHDIGKIGIPDQILRKAGRLSRQEYEIIKEHTVIGGKLLEGSEVKVLNTARQIAMCHHERWDGAGYPDGMSGDAIPESARIVAIVDVYDALVFDRVYRPALSESDAIDVLNKGVGTFFDPHIFDVFLRLLPAIRLIRRELVTLDMPL